MNSEQEGEKILRISPGAKRPRITPISVLSTGDQPRDRCRFGSWRPITSEANETLAILPVRGIVLFPGMVVPLTIGRPSAIKLVDSELPENKELGLVTQRDEQLDRPDPSDLYRIGVSAQVLKLIRQPDGVIILIVQVVRRICAGIVRSNGTLPPRHRANRQNSLSRRR